MKVNKVMTRNAECTRPDASLQEAAERMKALNVGALPVCENDRLVGMITDRDITVRATAGACDPAGTQVRDVMSPNIVYTFEDESVKEAVRLMEEHQIRRLPVLNRDKRLVGIVSLGDVAVRGPSNKLSKEALEKVSEPALPTR